ncbi:hypothetical protein ABEB36_006988 [Hypothenemus hampei]|uniref:Tumor protein p53-inducible nuclear protein 1 n=1 Tax=Hypothenemus hampei TaxID=57062 RepID=A0ABD1ESF9_HYPHA
MFQSLANYLLGTTTSNTGSAGGVDDNNSSNRVALRTTDHDDGWTMVDRDSEGNSDAYSSEEEDHVSGLERVRLNRTDSDDSLTHVHVHDMEESWFVTPPPCFSSQTGPVQLRTSPLENLLIEHPSMSVYQRTGNRHPRFGSPSPSAVRLPDELEDEEEIMADSVQVDAEPMVVIRIQRNPPHRSIPAVALNEMQVARHRQAQKVQTKKLAQETARSYQKRANKAREVNGRNYNARRKERCQGSNRSYASNNRKC